MADQIGLINVPDTTPVGTFPLTVEFGFTTIIAPIVKTFLFKGSGDLKREQRFLIGPGARQWHIERELDEPERIALRNFWESRQSAYQPFTFHVPLANGLTESITAQFSNAPLISDFMTGMVSRLTGIDLIEIPSTGGVIGGGPSYNVAVTLTRFPDATMASALTAQVQKLIKLVRIKPRLAGYPTIYLSDQRCTIGGQLYLPRLLKWSGIQQVAIGMPGVGTESDNVQLSFGNADRVMSRLVDNVQLDYATVELLAYHINSESLVELWAGEIIAGGWQSNTGPEFNVQCSDPISSPFLLAPPRVVGRKCDKLYLGLECPFSSHGALNITDYPAADASFCDHGYLTENGCAAHGMELFFNGVTANPQAILTKDNSTGFWGMGRSTLVASSIINDSAYGKPIPIIVTSINFPVPVSIISIRDEGDSLRALGVVGEGPMTIEIGSTLDGAFNHGYPSNLGFRYIAGNDPAGSPPTPDQMQMQPFDLPYYYSAGVAALELLIKDISGIQPSLATQHQMQALVSSGWKGWVWTGPGQRASDKVNLINPVWLAVNLFLFCTRLYTADAATQEAKLDLNTILPAAAICDLLVDRVVELDEGQETQWVFIGILQDQKALRDWLADILLNCLGYFSFNFGKLAIGVRENGASTVAYTDGNIIWRSLTLAPLGPQFTRLTATFADREHNYVSNTATFQDDDYAAELGGGALALHKDAQMNLSGTADISPATRFVITRGREEIGGVNAAERIAARNPTWQTTILGLDTGVGAVASITNEEMPNGFGKARIARWALNDDWSITFEGRYCTNSMYDLVQGPKPADVRPGDIPGAGSNGSDHHGCWMPNTQAPLSFSDPVRGQYDLSFGMQQIGSPSDCSLVVSGQQPVNLPQFKPGPRIADTAVVQGAGFLMPGTYYISIAAQLGTQPSAQSVIKKVVIPAAEPFSSIKLTGLSWPASTSDSGWDKAIVFAAADAPQRLCAQLEILAVNGVLPDSITLDGVNASLPYQPIKYATYAPANINYNFLRLKVKQQSHPGVIPGFVTAVSGSTFRCMHLASDRAQDTNPTEGGIVWNPDSTLLAADNWNGRIVSVITHKLDGIAPIINMRVTAYNPTNGEFTCVDPPADLNVGKGDVFIVRFAPVWNADFTSFTDLGMLNGQYWLGTSTITGDINTLPRIGRIIDGAGKGQTRVVTAHDDTSYTFESGFVGVDATSIIIIEFATWLASANGDALNITDYLQSTSLVRSMTGLLQKGLIVQGVIVDSDKVESPDELSEVREFFPFNDVSYGVGGSLQLGLEIEFGRGSDGGPAAIAANDISSIREALTSGYLQGASVVSQGVPVGDSILELLKQSAPGSDVYNSILSITIPAGTHDTVLFNSAFALSLDTLFVDVGTLFKVQVTSVGSTPPQSPVFKVYWGQRLALSNEGGGPILGNPVIFT